MTHVRSALLFPAALLASVALAPAVVAQQASPGFTAQDPMIARLQSRADAAEDSMRRLTGRLQEMGFETTKLRRTVEEQNDTITALEDRIDALNQRLEALENLANAPAEAARNAATGPAESTITLVGPTQPATHEARAAMRDEDATPGADLGLVSKSAASAESITLESDPDALFQQAKRLMTQGKFDLSEVAFQDFLDNNPDHEQAPNAYYWLGEVYAVQGAYEEAVDAFVSLASTFPTARRAPDAWWKLAQMMGKLDQPEQGCEYLDEMLRLYPKLDPRTRSGAARERDLLECSSR